MTSLEFSLAAAEAAETLAWNAWAAAADKRRGLALQLLEARGFGESPEAHRLRAALTKNWAESHRLHVKACPGMVRSDAERDLAMVREVEAGVGT